MKSSHKKIISGVVALFIFLLPAAGGLAWMQQHSPQWVYSVQVDGSGIGYVDTADQYLDIVGGILSAAEEKWGCNLVISQQVEMQKLRQWNPGTNSGVVSARANELFSFKRSAWAIYVNNSRAVVLGSEKEALELLEEIKQHYVSNASNRKLLAVSFIDTVEVVQVAVEPEDVLGSEEALEALLGGTEQLETHMVSRGETLSTIARSYNLSLSQLRGANPSIKEETIIPGQKLDLVLATPAIRVTIVEELSITERIPPPVRYVRSSSVWYYQTRVLESGTSGSREVVYRVESVNGVEVNRTMIGKNITRQPTARVIATGTSRWPSRATGMFSWPMRSGRISDRFGTWRRHGRHQGVDIAARRGTPIYAARGGVVIRAEYHRSYGYYVVIDHQNGYGTLYAHASKLRVRRGQQVSRGQVIAEVGSTGDSTGPHLHFEIFRFTSSGWQRLDPLRFYAP